MKTKMKETVTKQSRGKSLMLLAMGVSVVFVAAVSASKARADWYAGAAVSQAYVNESGLDENDTGGKIFGGYRFNDYIAAEAEYYDFGDQTDNTNSFSVNGAGLALVGSVPVTDSLSVFAKGGLHSWNLDVSGPIAAQFTDTSSTDPYYGVGIDYSINDRWGIRGEYTRYEVDNFDVDVASVGVVLSF